MIQDINNMARKFKKTFLSAIIIIFGFSILTPVFVLAADEKPVAATVVSLENPIKGNATDIRVIYGRALKVVLGILGSLALFVFIDGAWTWMTSLGNAEKVKKGTNAMVWAVVGIFAIFASYGILNALINIGFGARSDLGAYGSGQTASDATSTDKTESGGTNITGICAIKYTATCNSKKNERECNVSTVIKETSIQPCIFFEDLLTKEKSCDPKPDLGCGGLSQDKCVEPCEFADGKCVVKGGNPNCYVAGQGKTKEEVVAECKAKANCDWFESK